MLKLLCTVSLVGRNLNRSNACSTVQSLRKTDRVPLHVHFNIVRSFTVNRRTLQSKAPKKKVMAEVKAVFAPKVEVVPPAEKVFVPPKVTFHALTRDSGRIEYINGAIYEGALTPEGQRQGFGVLKNADGAKYEGFWDKDLKHGDGKLTQPDGRDVEGIFVEGKLWSGIGAYKWCGEVYTGVWEDGVLNGPGTHETKKGSKYVGQFQYSKYHGQGKLTLANGEIQEGEFCNGLLHGEGKKTNSSGGVFKGSFSEGKYHGLGAYTDQKGTYTGN